MFSLLALLGACLYMHDNGKIAILPKHVTKPERYDVV
jgi:hypothetical protein